MLDLFDVPSGGLLWWDEKYKNKQEYLTSGTFTIPLDFKGDHIIVAGCGAGGDGASTADGAGGGGSAVLFEVLKVSADMLGETYTILIGATAGANTTFGNLITFEGGENAVGTNTVGKGKNGGTNGTLGNNFGRHSVNSLIVFKSIKGCFVSKTLDAIRMPTYKGYGLGGIGGGYDHPTKGMGGNGEPSTSAGTEGICIVYWDEV